MKKSLLVLVLFAACVAGFVILGEFGVHVGFSFFVWLGYLNSFVNPVIYTIFNVEFRRAFKKLLTTSPSYR